jgi:RNA polymerase sigma factor (sigma-70 family)
MTDDKLTATRADTPPVEALDVPEPDAWRRLVRCDADALRVVINRLGERVFVAIRRQLSSSFSDDDVEDVWTATFAYVWKYAVRYDPARANARFDRWVMMVARWQIASYLRTTRRWRECRVALDDPVVSEPTTETSEQDIFDEYREYLDMCRPLLSSEEQLLLDLRGLGFSGAEIALRFGISEDAARQRVGRLFARLRELSVQFRA